jgi:hypothetical protein
MRRLAVYLALALLASAGAASTTDANGRGKAAAYCHPDTFRVLAEDKQARVEQLPPTVIHGCEIPGSAEIVGRAAQSRKTYALGPAPFGTTAYVGGVSNVSLTGPLVAYQRYKQAIGEEPSSVIVVRDLRTGRVIHRVPAERPGVRPIGLSPIVLKPDGAAAWIVYTALYADLYEVHAVDSAGNRVLATGSNIDLHSLALVGSTLYWTQGGQPMSAPLN